MNSSSHFTPKELECKCGCGTGRMNNGLLMIIERVRRLHGEPMVVSSAYRCPVHNNNVSSTGFDGPHTTGRAIDIKCYGAKANDIIRLALASGATGLGVNQKGAHEGRFIHVDNIEHGRPWVWSY